MKNIFVLTVLFSLAVCSLSFIKKDSSDVKTVLLQSPAEYRFTQKISYKITDKKGEVTNLVYRIGDNGVVMTIDPKSGVKVILDLQNSISVTVNEDQKTAMVMSTKMMEKIASKMITKNADEHESNMVKSGRVREISGYSCEEYVVTDKKSTTEVWITDEITIDYKEMMKGLGKYLGKSVDKEEVQKNGFMIESVYKNKKGEVENTTTITEFLEEEFTFLLENYKVQRIGLGM